MLHAIIMAGGTGTRFWPASTNDTPKQLLRLVGDATMLRQTVDRLGELVPNERRLVVTNERLVAAVRKQLPELPRQSIVGEPCKRDTAPCIGLAALLVSRDDPDATMVVMPADHVIRPAEKFQAAIRKAAQFVELTPARIVTFGIKPTYPAEVFGYIHRGQALREGEAPAEPPSRLGRSLALPYIMSSNSKKNPMPPRPRNTSTRANTIGTPAFSCGVPRRSSPRSRSDNLTCCSICKPSLPRGTRTSAMPCSHASLPRSSRSRSTTP